MKMNMSATLTSLGFFAVIGFAVWWTGSAAPLRALLLFPFAANAAKAGGG